VAIDWVACDAPLVGTRHPNMTTHELAEKTPYDEIAEVATNHHQHNKTSPPVTALQ